MGAGSSSASGSDAASAVQEAVHKEVDSLRKVIADIDAEDINRGLHGPKKDEALLISILCNRTKAQLERIDASYKIKFDKSLLAVIQQDIGGPIGTLLCDVLQDVGVVGASHFHAGFHGWGYKSTILSDILCTYSNSELNSIKQYYDENNDKPLLQRAKDELGGPIEELILNLIQGFKDETNDVDISLSVTQAEQLYKAGVGKHFGTDEEVFVEILGKASRAQIQAIKAAYINEYKMTLEKAIKKEIGKDLARILSGLACSSREVYIATALHEAIEGFGKDEDRVLRLLSMISKSQIAAVNIAYTELYGMDLCDSLKDEYKKGVIREVTLAWVAGNEPSQGNEFLNSTAMASGDEDQLSACNDSLQKERALLLDFIALSDATTIKRATEGTGTRDRALVTIICARTRAHLKRVDSYYQQLFGKSLVEQIQEESDGFYCVLMQYAVTPIDEVDAIVIKQALDAFGTNEYLLPECLIPLSNKRIQEMKVRFESKYGHSIVDRFNSELSGVMHQLIMAVIRGERDESSDVDKSEAKSHAKHLHAAKVEEGAVDDDAFIKLLTSCSFPQIQRINYEYTKRFDATLETLIRGETDGPLEAALASLLLAPADIYAVALHRAFNESDTDDSAVARILGSNDKAGIVRISEKYLSRYDQTLLEALEFHLTGHFRVACITYVASAKPIMPEELKAIVGRLPTDGDERMPATPHEVPEGRKGRMHKVRAITMTPPEIKEEDVVEELAEVSDGDEASEHSSDNPEEGAGWEMTPELKKLFNMKRQVARNGNKFKTRAISRKIKELINEQTGGK